MSWGVMVRYSLQTYSCHVSYISSTVSGADVKVRRKERLPKVLCTPGIDRLVSLFKLARRHPPTVPDSFTQAV